jgi:hypothetical protein
MKVHHRSFFDRPPLIQPIFAAGSTVLLSVAVLLYITPSWPHLLATMFPRSCPDLPPNPLHHQRKNTDGKKFHYHHYHQQDESIDLSWFSDGEDFMTSSMEGVTDYGHILIDDDFLTASRILHGADLQDGSSGANNASPGFAVADFYGRYVSSSKGQFVDQVGRKKPGLSCTPIPSLDSVIHGSPSNADFSSKNNRGSTLRWNDQEVEALLSAVDFHGKGNWDVILQDPKYARILGHRRKSALQSKWTRIMKDRGLSTELDNEKRVEPPSMYDHQWYYFSF